MTVLPKAPARAMGRENVVCLFVVKWNSLLRGGLQPETPGCSLRGSEFGCNCKPRCGFPRREAAGCQFAGKTCIDKTNLHPCTICSVPTDVKVQRWLQYN
jgi:hypothetical protein